MTCWRRHRPFWIMLISVRTQEKFVAADENGGAGIQPLAGGSGDSDIAAVGEPRRLVVGAQAGVERHAVQAQGRAVTTIDYAEDAAVSAADIERALAANPAITHVALVHCETSTGILNPLEEIAQVVARQGRSLIVDAMSSFGALEIDARRTPFDAVVAASGKCLEGPPGMGFVIVRRAVLERCEGNSHSLAMDLHDQWVYMQKTTQWRYTPPTHVVAAFDAAIAQYLEEGGRAARHARYALNCRTLIEGMARLGLRSFLPAAIQAPIIVTFFAPDSPRYVFRDFYDAVKARGYILYPGKLTTVETFRVGCMGQLGERGIAGAVEAVGEVLAEMRAAA